MAVRVLWRPATVQSDMDDMEDRFTDLVDSVWDLVLYGAVAARRDEREDVADRTGELFG